MKKLLLALSFIAVSLCGQCIVPPSSDGALGLLGRECVFPQNAVTTVIEPQSVVQVNTSNGLPVHSVQLTLGAAVVAGHTLLVLGTGGGSPTSEPLALTDDQGNTYALVMDYASDTNTHMAVWLADRNAKPGSTTFTLTYTDSSYWDLMQLYVLELSGTYGLDVTGTAFGTDTTSVSTSQAVTDTHELIVGWFNDYTNLPNWTGGTGFTFVPNGPEGTGGAGSGVEYKVLTDASGVQTATMTTDTTGDYKNGIILTFKGTAPASQ